MASGESGPWGPGQREGDVTVAVTATLDDQVRFNAFLLRQPAFRRRRAIQLVLNLSIYPLVGLLIGFVAGSILSGEKPTPQRVIDLVRDDVWTNLVLPWGLLVGLYVMVWVAWWATLRLRMRRLIRRELRERPGVDPADPELAERVRCTFGPGGYRVESAGYSHAVPWQGIRALDETADLLVVRTGLLKGYVIPKRNIPPDRLAAIRTLAAAHLGAAPR